MPTILPAFNTIILAASYVIGKIRSFGFLQFCLAYSRRRSATFGGINTTSCSFPLFGSLLFFRKLKKDERWANRTRLVRGLQPSVMVLKNCRILSGDISDNSSPPKSLQSRLITHLYARTVFFFRIGMVIIDPDF